MKTFTARKLFSALLAMAMLLMVLSAWAMAEAEEAPINLLINPDFEEICDPNENEGCSFTGWYYDTTAESWSVLFADGPAQSGEVAAATWCADPFVMTWGQDFTITEAGTYKASAWVALGYASFEETILRVTKAGEVVAQISLPAAPENADDSYREIVLEGIELETGDYTFEVLVNCTVVGANSFARVDNAFLGK